MPLIELLPPSTLPRGQGSLRFSRVGSGSDLNRQSNRGLPIALVSAAGIRMKGDLSDPPASSSNTLLPGSADRRLASTQPADPAPTMMKSRTYPPFSPLAKPAFFRSRVPARDPWTGSAAISERTAGEGLGNARRVTRPLRTLISIVSFAASFCACFSACAVAADPARPSCRPHARSSDATGSKSRFLPRFRSRRTRHRHRMYVPGTAPGSPDRARSHNRYGGSRGRQARAGAGPAGGRP